MATRKFKFRNMAQYVRNVLDPQIVALKLQFLALVFPRGTMVMYRGYFGGSDGKRPSIDGMPVEAFALCDGTNGTPDMTVETTRINADNHLSGEDTLSYIMKVI